MRKSSICFECANHECEWIQDDLPVPEWKAVPTIIKDFDHYGNVEFVNSFCVSYCPKYRKYETKILGLINTKKKVDFTKYKLIKEYFIECKNVNEIINEFKIKRYQFWKKLNTELKRFYKQYKINIKE